MGLPRNLELQSEVAISKVDPVATCTVATAARIKAHQLFLALKKDLAGANLIPFIECMSILREAPIYKVPTDRVTGDAMLGKIPKALVGIVGGCLPASKVGDSIVLEYEPVKTMSSSSCRVCWLIDK